MGTRLAATALAAGLLAVGCSGSSPGPTPSTPASSSGSASPSSTASSPAPPATTDHFRSGKATVRVSGSIKGRFTMPLAPGTASVWQPSTGVVTVKYLSRDANALILNGTLAGKTSRTSSNLTLSFILQHGGSVAFASTGGECTVHLTRVSPHELAGRFTCPKLASLQNKRRKVAATGTFEAAA